MGEHHSLTLWRSLDLPGASERSDLRRGLGDENRVCWPGQRGADPREETGHCSGQVLVDWHVLIPEDQQDSDPGPLEP